MSAKRSAPDATAAAPSGDRTVRFLATIAPTATDRMQYDAGTEWSVSAARAEQLVADGLAVLVSSPSAAPAAASE
jgi:hypothetical protein